QLEIDPPGDNEASRRADCGQRGQANGVTAMGVDDLGVVRIDDPAQRQYSERVELGERTQRMYLEAHGPRARRKRLTSPRGEHRANAQVLERAGEPEGLALAATPT